MAHTTTGATEHRSEDPKKGQQDFLEEVASKLSATRKKDPRGTWPPLRPLSVKTYVSHTAWVKRQKSLSFS